MRADNLIVLMLPFAFPAAYFFGLWFGFPNVFAILPLVITEVLLPLADRLLGEDFRNPSAAQDARWRTSTLISSLPLVAGVLHLLMLGFAAWVVLVVHSIAYINNCYTYYILY